MRCAKCGATVKPTDLCCPNCSQTCTEIQLIQDIEAEDNNREQMHEWPGYDTYGSTGSGRHIHVKQINFSRKGIWSTLLSIVLLMAIFLFALPLFLLLALVLAILWLVLRCRYSSR